MGNGIVLFWLKVIDIKTIRCDECKKYYPFKDVHLILGVLVCVHCYPDVTKYCDCCSDSINSNEINNISCESVEDVNRKLF